LKRAFVDVIFLIGRFEDFHYPQVNSMTGVRIGIVSTAQRLSSFLEAFDGASPRETLRDEIEQLVLLLQNADSEVRFDSAISLGDQALDAYVLRLRNEIIFGNGTSLSGEKREAQRFVDALVNRLDHFGRFVDGVYRQQDLFLRQELRDAIVKTFAASVGSYLGFAYLRYASEENSERRSVELIKRELITGI
jgi:hypothetical protein